MSYIYNICICIIIYIRHHRVALLFTLSLLILSLCYSRYFECDQSPRVCHAVAKLYAISSHTSKIGRRNCASLFRCMKWRGIFAERYMDHIKRSFTGPMENARHKSINKNVCLRAMSISKTRPELNPSYKIVPPSDFSSLFKSAVCHEI